MLICVIKAQGIAFVLGIEHKHIRDIKIIYRLTATFDMSIASLRVKTTLESEDGDKLSSITAV